MHHNGHMFQVHRISVSDLTDDRLNDYTHLTDVALRRKREPERGMYIAESSTVIRRALAAGHTPRSFLMAERWLESLQPQLDEWSDVPVFVGDEAALEELTGFHLHRGALAAMQRPVLPSVTDVIAGARRIAILEDIVDHTNVGAIFRSAAAIGLDAVLVTPQCADPLYRRSIRVSMGTVFQVPWTRFGVWPHGPSSQPDGVDLLRESGFTVAALALTDDAITLDDLAASLPERLALVLGTEGDGLRPATVAACDQAVRIPMAGYVDSLNVNAAAAVAFWATRVPVS